MQQPNIATNNPLYLTDGGLETTLIFQHGIDLPHFAAFDLLNKPQFHHVLEGYYRNYLELAKKYSLGFILESATWRANPDWGYRLGYTEGELMDVNLMAIRQLQLLKEEYRKDVPEILISGCIGPRYDGYEVGAKMNEREAQQYHEMQISAFKKAQADMVSALTINYVAEALGIVRAARANEIPAVVSFTVETDGVLPGGESLEEAIERVDAETDAYPLYYMINCAHPTHFVHQLKKGKAWASRIKGIRANASCKSHAELDEATELDIGNKTELANWYASINGLLPGLKVFGGCCGTDETHMEAICSQIC